MAKASRSALPLEDPRPKRGRPSEGAREAILAATLDLAAEQGLARLTTKEVARRAGVSEASVFYHFADKVGLLEEAIVAGSEPLMELDAALLSGAGEGTVDDSLLEFATSLERFFDRVLPVLSAVQGDAELRAAFAKRMTERDLGPHRGITLLGQALAGMQQRGTVDRSVDAEAVALAVIGSCFMRSWQRYLFGRRPKQGLPDIARTMRALADLIQPHRATGDTT
ncbi:MAG: TetR/AcrR family transcriptional regulator [Acidimicrobiales bacterium]